MEGDSYNSLYFSGLSLSFPFDTGLLLSQIMLDIVVFSTLNFYVLPLFLGVCEIRNFFLYFECSYAGGIEIEGCYFFNLHS